MPSSRNRPPAAVLPDIDDELFKARLKPLADSVLPRSGAALPSDPTPMAAPAGTPAALRTASTEPPQHDPDIRNSGIPIGRDTGRVPDQTGPFSALRVVEQTRAARGPRRGVEFLLPERVVAALRVQAAESGVSLSVKLLEVLRNAGYPVIDEDFVDIRRLPKR